MVEGAKCWNAVNSGLEQTSQEVSKQTTYLQKYGYCHEISSGVVHIVSYLFWWNIRCFDGWSANRRSKIKGGLDK